MEWAHTKQFNIYKRSWTEHLQRMDIIKSWYENTKTKSKLKQGNLLIGRLLSKQFLSRQYVDMNTKKRNARAQVILSLATDQISLSRHSIFTL